MWNKRSYLIILGILLVGLLAACSPALPAQSQVANYLVQGADAGVVADLVTRYGGEVTSFLPVIHGVGAHLPEDAVARLLAEPEVTAITPNASVELVAAPVDQAAEVGNENSVPATDYADVVGADYVWGQGITGEGVTVAVVDTGIEEQPGLKQGLDSKNGRIIGWVDFVDGAKKPIDPNGHGTHISGIIANTETGADGEWNGVAPGVDLVGVRVLDKTGSGTYEDVIQGIQWVIDHQAEYNIRVINLSLVALVQSPYWGDPLNQAVMQAWAEGIMVVVAAGNLGPAAMTVGVPGNVPYVVTVGAFTDNYTPEDWNDDYLASFSAAGPTLDGFVKPDVVGPGAHMVSTMHPSSYLAKTDMASKITSQYYSMAGTSQSAAVASGVAALVLSGSPDLTPDQVKYRMMSSALVWVDLETTDALYSMWQQGAGRIAAPDAVFSEELAEANLGMDIAADLARETHYEGYSYYDEKEGAFRLHGEFSDWAGGFGSWAGGFGSWAGGFGSWAGGFGSWAGGFGSWAGGFGSWAGGFGSWAGGFGSWAGGFGSWAGGFGSWAGGFGSWAGGFGSWAGGFGSWAGMYGDAAFAAQYSGWTETDTADAWMHSQTLISVAEEE